MNPLRIRPAREEDLPRLVEIYNHFVVHTPITFDLQPYDPQGRRAWFDEHVGSGRHRLLVAADEQGQLLGYATTSRWRAKAAYDTTTGKAKLTWTASKEMDLSGSRVYRWNPAAKAYERIADAGAGALEYFDTGAARGTTSYYWVTAVAADGTESLPTGDYAITAPAQ